LSLDEFLDLLALLTHQEKDKLKVKVIEESIVRRVDKLIYNLQDPNKLNNLKDLKIVDNSALLIEIKTDQDMQELD